MIQHLMIMRVFHHPSRPAEIAPGRSRARASFLPIILLPLLASSLLAADWPMHRGNAQRTGNIDNIPGPRNPRVLWMHESTEHFIASPVPGERALYVSGLGAFNTPAFHALSLDPGTENRELWKKLPPLLRQAMVSSPAIVEGKLIFGDGMHQTDGATLHCLSAETGRPVWQLSVAGSLVHIEGSPAVHGGRVFIGAGAAGVLCVDLNRLILDGREQTADAIQRIVEAKWRQMVEEYEEEKKIDPDFAVPPSEASLPMPTPQTIWQTGKEKWHVDAPLLVHAGRVLVPSAFLDHEKVGERALFCLDAATGATLWQTQLRLNPWSGPSLAMTTAPDGTPRQLILIGCSNIRLDPSEVPHGKGELLAVDLETGASAWRIDLSGGVVSPIAVARGLAIFTATDGKVRAVSTKDGAEQWSYDAGAPFFAGSAIASLVYAADLTGVIHALDVLTGEKVWALDLAAAPIRAPGQIYGSPVVHQGRLYLATANLDADGGDRKTVIVCIGDK